MLDGTWAPALGPALASFMSPNPSRSLLHIHHLFGRRRRRQQRGESSGGGKGMGCAQGKPSRGSPARSDDLRGIDRLMRDNAYRPASGTSRLSDPLPVAATTEWARPAKEPGARAAGTGNTEKKRTPPDDDDAAAATATNAAATPPLPPPPRREDELVDGWPTWLLDNVPREALHGIVPKSADAYDKIEKVGQGTYSNVYKARERGTGRIVALKKVRFDTSESESVRFMAREIRILQTLDHPNVIRLEGIATSRMHRSIYLVFEFMYSDLARLVARAGEQRLTEPQIKSYMQQLLSGLHHCHERGVLHRDIKGSNLLIDRHGVLKIGDFGLANHYGRRRPLTSRVVTLWYRAPELLLSATDYGVGIDLWSAGCLLAEMFIGKALMPGRTEVEQLYRIFTLCGSPPDEYWRKQKASAAFRPTKAYKSTMAERLRGLPPSARSLISTLLALDPAARGTAAQALQSDFFSTPPLPCDLSSLPVVYKEEEVVDPSTSHDGRKPKLRQRGSTRRKDTRPKAEEQQADEPKINSGSPEKAEDRVTDAAKSGQESAGAVVLNASSSVQESPESDVVNASKSKRFAVSPIQITYLTQEEASPAAPQDPPLPKAGRHQHSGSDEDHDSEDDLADIGESSAIVLGHSVERRPASVTDYDAAVVALRESSGELPSKQYVLVDHV